MSAIQSKIADFLENGGYRLDYTDHALPDLDDMDSVLKHSIPVWEYFGKTQKEYYGGEDE